MPSTGLWALSPGSITTTTSGRRWLTLSVIRSTRLSPGYVMPGTMWSITWARNEWDKFVSGLGVIWDRLKGLATSAWNGVRDAVMSVVNPLISWARNEMDR